LVDFYDDNYRGDAVRVAVLLQPVAMQRARTMAVVQVAETLELRCALARQILFNTLWRQLALVSVIALVVFVVVQRATRPVRNLSLQLQQRRADDLTPLAVDDAPPAPFAGQPEALCARHRPPVAHAAGCAQGAGAVGPPR
jgi:two-component system sensor histidine kinase TctE